MARSSLVVIAILTFPVGCWSSPAPIARPPPTPPLPPRPQFVDQPLGEGTCKWISVGESSEIVGQQLQYHSDDSTYRCLLVPTNGDAHSRPRIVVSQVFGEQDVWTPPARVGEQSVWSGSMPFATLRFSVADVTLDVDLILPSDQMPVRAQERKAFVEAIARKVYARVKTNPDS
jgi:hypothetical protein